VRFDFNHRQWRRMDALSLKTRITMKTSKGNESRQSKQQRQSHKPKPEIRDDMDSRKKREEGFNRSVSKKGDRKRVS
jgi:hypothetical protein